MSDQKTEQPTPRRREKAREQGQVVRSRELSSALAVLAAVLVVGWRAQSDLGSWRAELRSSLDLSTGTPHLAGLLQTTSVAALYWMAPSMLAAWAIALAVSFAQGGVTWAPAALAFRPDRFSVGNRLKQLVSATALSGMLRTLIPAAVILYIACGVLAREWSAFAFSMFRSRGDLMPWIFGLIFEIAWKSGLVMLIWSGADYLFIRYRIEGELKMSRDELKREHRESEGDPVVKGRIRRLQRQARRQRMLQDVPKAAVVIMNPTHYAIALAYTAELPAPVLIAKGRDRLALEIKDIARWHEIPMVENPPLAHALYRAASVGDSIPSRLYVAVAEVLAFVYRVQAASRNGRRS